MQEALKFVESPEMALHLIHPKTQTRLSGWCNLVVLSHASLADKATALNEIGKKYPADEFCNPAKMAESAEKALELTQNAKPGTVFMLTHYWRGNRDETAGNWDFIKNFSIPHVTFEQAVQGIREEFGGDETFEPKDNDTRWYEISRYDISDKGRLEEVIMYTVGESGVIWGFDYDTELEDECEKGIFSIYNFAHLNLSTPYQPGDIITADCRPFQEVFHSVILKNDMPNDCCSPWCIYVNQLGRLECGALKHNFRCRQHAFSPLLRVARYNGELSGEEAPLKTISEKIKEAPDLGNRIDDYFLQNHQCDSITWEELKAAFNL